MGTAGGRRVPAKGRARVWWPAAPVGALSAGVWASLALPRACAESPRRVAQRARDGDGDMRPPRPRVGAGAAREPPWGKAPGCAIAGGATPRSSEQEQGQAEDNERPGKRREGHAGVKPA